MLEDHVVFRQRRLFGGQSRPARRADSRGCSGQVLEVLVVADRVRRMHCARRLFDRKVSRSVAIAAGTRHGQSPEKAGGNLPWRVKAGASHASRSPDDCRFCAPNVTALPFAHGSDGWRTLPRRRAPRPESRHSWRPVSASLGAQSCHGNHHHHRPPAWRRLRREHGRRLNGPAGASAELRAGRRPVEAWQQGAEERHRARRHKNTNGQVGTGLSRPVSNDPPDPGTGGDKPRPYGTAEGRTIGTGWTPTSAGWCWLTPVD